MSTPATKTLPLATALGQSEPLNSLLRRLHDSRERLGTVAALQAQVADLQAQVTKLQSP